MHAPPGNLLDCLKHFLHITRVTRKCSNSQYNFSLLPSAPMVLLLLKLLSEEHHSQPVYFHHPPVTQARLLSQSVTKSTDKKNIDCSCKHDKLYINLLIFVLQSDSHMHLVCMIELKSGDI